ncbi:unnamed protein product [Tilletia laevis]|uniref:ASX DEUBAD domain-containing protein n=1 Tax=Tilletia caries TaxID=13290 RepID=A0ABN7IKJ9_9BASI|nr:unnamed protein product [Tilletia caries]CAD6954225.1 unnamed protein product [Tilletia laevis]CAD7060927.1 unnamed protein product [Tilletia caries]
MTLSLYSQAPNNDEICFDLFSQFVWGDLNEPGLSNQLSQLDVPSTEANTWRAFTTDYGKQVKSSQEKGQPIPALNQIPKIRDPQVKGWWETLAGAPSQDTWPLDGAHPSKASTDTPSSHI